MYKLDFEKAEEPGTELPTLILFWRKQESYRGKKNCFNDYPKAFDCRSLQIGEFLKREEYQTALPVS